MPLGFPRSPSQVYESSMIAPHNALLGNQREVKRQREENAGLRKDNDMLKDKLFEMETGIGSSNIGQVPG